MGPTTLFRKLTIIETQLESSSAFFLSKTWSEAKQVRIIRLASGLDILGFQIIQNIWQRYGGAWKSGETANNLFFEGSRIEELS